MEQKDNAPVPQAPPQLKVKAVPEVKKPIQVKAIQAGYYDNRRIEPGQKFNLKNDQEFSEVWMEDLSGRLPLKKEAAPEKSAE